MRDLFDDDPVGANQLKDHILQHRRAVAHRLIAYLPTIWEFSCSVAIVPATRLRSPSELPRV